MPRKSIFRRNKNKTEEKQEEQTEETGLQRSSVDPTSLNVEEFSTFAANVSEDGTTLDINTADFAIDFDTKSAEYSR